MSDPNYYNNNKERLREYQRAYYHENSAKIREYQKQYFKLWWKNKRLIKSPDNPPQENKQNVIIVKFSF
jgi:hypothetical protein